MEDTPAQDGLTDDLTLGDVDKDLSSKGLSTKMKFIIFGSAGACLLLILIIILIIVIPSKSSKKELSKTGEINCIFNVESTSSTTQILGENFNKNSEFTILIEGQEKKFTKSYKFDKIGEKKVQFILYEKINMDKMFQNVEALTSVSLISDKEDEITSMKSTFEGCINLNFFNITGFNTKNLTSISKIFYNCENLENIYLEQLDTTNVEDMSYAFANTQISYFNFESIKIYNLKNTSHMFYECTNLINIDLPIISSTESLEDISYMFSSCSSLSMLEMNNLNTENVKNMSGLFSGCLLLSDLYIDKIKTSSVTDMSYMFEYCGSLSKLDLL